MARERWIRQPLVAALLASAAACAPNQRAADPQTVEAPVASGSAPAGLPPPHALPIVDLPPLVEKAYCNTPKKDDDRIPATDSVIRGTLPARFEAAWRTHLELSQYALDPLIPGGCEIIERCAPGNPLCGSENLSGVDTPEEIACTRREPSARRAEEKYLKHRKAFRRQLEDAATSAAADGSVLLALADVYRRTALPRQLVAGAVADQRLLSRFPELRDPDRTAAKAGPLYERVRDAYPPEHRFGWYARVRLFDFERLVALRGDYVTAGVLRLMGDTLRRRNCVAAERAFLAEGQLDPKRKYESRQAAASVAYDRRDAARCVELSAGQNPHLTALCLVLQGPVSVDSFAAVEEQNRARVANVLGERALEIGQFELADRRFLLGVALSGYRLDAIESYQGHVSTFVARGDDERARDELTAGRARFGSDAWRNGARALGAKDSSIDRAISLLDEPPKPKAPEDELKAVQARAAHLVDVCLSTFGAGEDEPARLAVTVTALSDGSVELSMKHLDGPQLPREMRACLTNLAPVFFAQSTHGASFEAEVAIPLCLTSARGPGR